MAARGAGATDEQVADYWLSGGKHAFIPRLNVCRFCAAAARAQPDRGPPRCDRGPLGEGRNERFAEFAAEFVRLGVDVSVASGTANIVAAKRATSVIPIVFAAAGNPVGSGLVASLAQPGGNLTGL